MNTNSTTQVIIWVSTAICAVAALIVLIFQNSLSRAAVLGCAALVFAIIGGTARSRASR